MKKLLTFLLASLLLLCLAACTTPAADTPLPPTTMVEAAATQPPAAPTEPPPAPTNTPAEAPEPVVLELVSPSASKSLTMADLKALPAVEGQAGIKSSTGKITLPAAFKGVTLAALADLVGGLQPDLGLEVVAEDGYAMTFSVDQVTKGDFIAYDPGTGDETTLSDPLTLAVVYERDGQPLDAKSDGTLRLAILSPKNNQVTDGHWSVKWVSKIELKPLGAEWDLELHGAIQEALDRNSFQSCAAPGCHQATWTDDKAQVWVGTPLWLLVGRVDDAIRHDGPAYFEALADAGYTVEIVATDGYTVSLDSVKVKRNNELVVAYQVNDTPLPDEYFPLRLVGVGLEKKEMVGAIDKIELKFDPGSPAEALAATAAAPTPEAATAPAAEVSGSLVITGLVDQPLGLDEAALRAMSPVQITAEHPKKGSEQYEGVPLAALLEQAKVQSGAKQIVFTAADGYAVTADLATVLACPNCLVAFTNTPESFKMVMPGLDSGLWVKDVVKIELK